MALRRLALRSAEPGRLMEVAPLMIFNMPVFSYSTTNMKIYVEYINQQGVMSVQQQQITLLGFLKHLAITGQGADFGLLPSLARGLGAALFYGRQIDFDLWLAFKGFRRPDMRFLDPTEQGDFSTLVGKGVADYLAKRLLGAKFSHTYEAAMYAAGYQLSGPRPDFYCTTPTQQFAMEAKGLSQRSVSPIEMATHKRVSGWPNSSSFFGCVSVIQHL